METDVQRKDKPNADESPLAKLSITPQPTCFNIIEKKLISTIAFALK